ncbi:MAG TPA: DUF3987 domain-containing protein [Candidatus Sulfotelmatobacter sp.]
MKTIEPHTEADPAALLVQTVTAFGNMIGRNPHFVVEATRHAANIFSALVGISSKSRKGTSWGYELELFSLVDSSWARKRVQPGLSTGEGLIQSLAELDSQDRRLLVFEDEMSAVLRVMSRWGNTLSTTLRRAWDCQPLHVMTRDRPLRVSNPHVSIVAQTTHHDIHRYLGQSDIFNGFANRFLWVCVKRSKFLPNGGGLEKKQFATLAGEVRRSATFATKQKQIGLSKHAAQLWEKEYSTLSADVPGLVGAATSRAEAQVRRLAMIYALMERCPEVKTRHLEAGLAVWKYCNDSAHFIFADRLEISFDNRLLSILRDSHRSLTRTEISSALGRHTSSDMISRTLHDLRAKGLVQSKQRKTEGRSAEVWDATPNKERAE